MEELLEWMEYIEDVRQKRKVRHKLKDILVIVLFATLADADDWVEIAMFANVYQDYLRKYIDLKNGVPSHDTIQRVMGMVSPDILQQLYSKWQELLNRGEGEVLKKIICIDGKTMRSNKRKGRILKKHMIYAVRLHQPVGIVEPAHGRHQVKSEPPGIPADRLQLFSFLLTDALRQAFSFFVHLCPPV